MSQFRLVIGLQRKESLGEASYSHPDADGLVQ